MDAPDPLLQRPVRRRKVRKGTFSCWECKRRKRRCEIKPPQTECAWCRQRGLPCRSQELEDADTDARCGVESRIRHVEGLVDQLLQQNHHHNASQVGFGDKPHAIVSIPNVPSRSTISISSYLSSVFPPPSEAAMILSRGKFFRMPLRMLGTAGKHLIQESQRPPPGAHPIEFACRLMQLALCLQESSSSEHVQRRALYYVDIVSNHVSSVDVLMDSPRGLDLLLLEVLYLTNKGSVRSAWLKSRRALSIAQLIGLDRASREEVTDVMTWRRLLYCDRFLSVELGLANLLVDENDLDIQDDGAAKLEFTHIHVSGRVIALNLRMQKRKAISEQKEIREIDYIMKQATRRLPGGWWAINAPLSALTEEAAMMETGKLLLQQNHYWLLVHLHLPHVIQQLCYPSDGEHVSYSTSALSTVCREVLIRYHAIREYHRGTLYRGLDVKALMAAGSLLLTHINGHRNTWTNVLEHQRPQDLDLVDRILTTVGGRGESEANTGVIRTLLKIEADTMSGVHYLWTRQKGGILDLNIPYFGTLSAVADVHTTEDPNDCAASIAFEHPATDWLADLLHFEDAGQAEGDHIWCQDSLL